MTTSTISNQRQRPVARAQVLDLIAQLGPTTSWDEVFDHLAANAERDAVEDTAVAPVELAHIRQAIAAAGRGGWTRHEDVAAEVATWG